MATAALSPEEKDETSEDPFAGAPAGGFRRASQKVNRR